MKKRLLALLLCMMVVLGMFAGCSNAQSGNEEKNDGPYTVTVISLGKKALAGAKVQIYKGAEMVAEAETNEEGKVEFDLEDSEDYVIVVSNLPDVYTLESEYTFEGKEAEIVPGSFLPAGTIGYTVIKSGDTMFEFTFQSSDGETISLTDLLAEKELVVLNFWYESCGYCSMELPYLIEAYEMHEDEMIVLGMNLFDDLTKIRNYKTGKGVPYPLGLCSGKWETTFSLRGYPTSVLIDRNGIVQKIIIGALDSTEKFCAEFEPYLGDDYQSE